MTSTDKEVNVCSQICAIALFPAMAGCAHMDAGCGRDGFVVGIEQVP